MGNLESILGLVIVVLTVVLILVLSLKSYRAKHPPVFRAIEGIQKLKRALGLAVEQGTGIHISLGKASLLQPSSTSAFVGLTTLHRLAQMSAASDQPPVSTSGDGSLAVLSQDVLITAARETNTFQQIQSDSGQLSGVTPLSYVAGALNVVDDPRIKTNILIGNFGPEAGFLSVASDENDAFTIAASDSLGAQAVFYATAGQPLIGEELYAVPGYLQYSPVHQSSLQAQDVLRWIIALVMIGGAILKVAGMI